MKKYNQFWNFKDYSMKEGVHGLHPYPAMLMPMIVKTIFDKINNNKIIFYDPFVGSGTTLVEAQKKGFYIAIGTDLNPLALLISKVKTSNYNIKKINDYIEDFIINFDKNKILIPEFSIINNWFKEYVILDLGKISSFISKIKDEKISDFFKVCFSETIRFCSYTRNSEFKMYRMNLNDRKKFNPDVFETMVQILKRNRDSLSNKMEKNTNIILKDMDCKNISLDTKDFEKGVDLIVTSPPYGDSHTTVAYGQFSRLSNEWLNISSAKEIDKKLLGGKKESNENYKFGIKILDDCIKQIKEKDKLFNSNRVKDVIAFYKDYQMAINSISSVLNKGAKVVFIVGNRRVRNIELPTHEITKIMFEMNGLKYKETIVRDILNKRMPSKATGKDYKLGPINTMSKEYIVFMDN